MDNTFSGVSGRYARTFAGSIDEYERVVCTNRHSPQCAEVLLYCIHSRVCMAYRCRRNEKRSTHRCLRPRLEHAHVDNPVIIRRDVSEMLSNLRAQALHCRHFIELVIFHDPWHFLANLRISQRRRQVYTHTHTHTCPRTHGRGQGSVPKHIYTRSNMLLLERDIHTRDNECKIHEHEQRKCHRVAYSCPFDSTSC